MHQQFSIDYKIFEESTAGGNLGSAFVKNYFKRLLTDAKVTKVLEKMNTEERDKPFCTAALNALGVSTCVEERQLRFIPQSGPTVVVSNHPFGAIEGIALTALLTQIRSDVKVIANSFLKILPGICEHAIFVNPFETKQARRENINAVRRAATWVKDGGLLLVFPAGEVSHFTLKSRRVTDPKWNTAAAKIALKTGATVVPVHVSGSNSIGFHAAGLIHPMLRTALLPSQLFNKKGMMLKLQIGTPVSKRRIREFSSACRLNDYLRTRTYALAGRESAKHSFQPSNRPLEEIVAATDKQVLQKELDALGEANHLVQHKEMSVYLASAEQIPLCMRELGRLRELTFRAVDEGTGKSIDIDRHDQHYLHLVLWDRRCRKIAGAYRLGPTDKIVSAHGFKGLYTHTLFKFSPRLKEKLMPALELGRSFICPEYQRRPMSLALLWKGIGQYICRNPQYRLLFGPVTISAEYKKTSIQLIMEYFRRNASLEDAKKLVRPKNPVKVPFMASWDIDSVVRGLCDEKDLSTVISDLEDDAKGLPILIKQYLNLHGRILAFNVDGDFSDVVDGLILVDLLQSPVEILRRFMGKTAADTFLAYHEERNTFSAAS